MPKKMDHCHNTGTFRGVLCSSCNRALGLLKDNPDVVMAAYKYLNGWKPKRK